MRLVEDCSKRGGALVSDVVGPETASEGWRGDGERVSMSTGADTKANTRDLVRAPGSLLERLQRVVALEALGESSSSLGTEVVVLQPASTGAEAGAEACQWVLILRKRFTGRRRT